MKKLWHHTLTYKTYEMFASWWQYKKDIRIIGDTLYSNQFALVLKKYLNLDVKKDWIGRLYGIINPNIDEQGRMDVTRTIIEIDGPNTNSNEYVYSWLYKQLELIKTLFKLEKLYDYIGVDMKHVGPINLDNYLVVIYVVSNRRRIHALKQFFKQLAIYVALATLFLEFKFLI